MSLPVILKAALVWLLLMLLAIFNGLLREHLLIPAFGHSVALPLSGCTLALMVVAIAYLTVPFFGNNTASTWMWIGFQWLLMTLLFELMFGHYVVGKSWADIARVFNPFTGNLFVPVLIILLFSPYFSAKTRGYCGGDSGN